MERLGAIVAPNLTGREVVSISRAGEVYGMAPGLSALKTASTKIRMVLALLQDACVAWFQDNAPSMSAALTFYVILSLIPVLIVATAVAGMGFWQKMAEAEAFRQIQGVLGKTSAGVLQAAVRSANRPAIGAIAGTFGIVTILVGASGAFIELQDALNKVWRVERKPGSLLLHVIKQRSLSFILVLCTGFLLLLSLISSASLAAAHKFILHVLPRPVFLLELIDFLLWFGLITLLLAMIFKLLPKTRIAWSDVWIGAAIASLLLTVVKVVVGLYLGRFAVASAYGAMSSPLVILAWLYYSAQILIFGAEVTRVYAHKHGSRAKSTPA